jgi:hypothetical protein
MPLPLAPQQRLATGYSLVIVLPPWESWSCRTACMHAAGSSAVLLVQAQVGPLQAATVWGPCSKG